LSNPIITLTTDYGTNDHLVGVLKGVILRINPDVQIVDITHNVTPFDLLDGATVIANAYTYFPPHDSRGGCGPRRWDRAAPLDRERAESIFSGAG
jgi:hypothetical protein